MKRTTIFFMLLLIFGKALSQSQIVKDSLTAESFFNKGVSLRANGSFDEAITSFDSAKYYFMIAQDTGLYFITITDISWCYILKGEFEDAMNLCNAALEEVRSYDFDSEGIFYRQMGIITSSQSDYESSLQYFIKTKDDFERRYGKEHNRYARALEDISITHHRMGQYAKALEYRMEALEVQKKNKSSLMTQINANLNLGALYYDISDYTKSLQYGLIALELSLSDPNQVKTTTADIYENVGNCYKSLGQYEKAIQYLEKTMSIRNEIFGDSHYKIANTYQNLASCYTQLGRKEEMIDAYEKSYAMRQETLGESHIRTIEGLKHLGIGYLDIEDFEKAESLLLEALDQENARYGESHIQIAMTLNNLGQLNRRKGNYDKGIEYGQKAAEMFKKLYKGNGHLLSQIYLSLARTFLEKQDFEMAIESLNKSFEANGMKLSNDAYAPPHVEYYSGLRGVLESMMLKVEILEKSDLDLDIPKLVMQHVDSVSSMVNRIKDDFGNQSDLFFLIKIYHDFVDKAVYHTYTAYEESQDEELLYKALEYIESSKDNLLTQKLYRINVREFSDVPDSLLLQEKILRSKIEAAKNKLASTDSLRLAFSEEIFDLNHQLDQLSRIFKEDYPSYYKISYGAGEVNSTELNSYLNESESQILVYFSGKENLYSMNLSKDNKTFKKNLKSENFDEAIYSFREAISNLNDQSYEQKSVDLYKLLVQDKEALKGGQRLVIITDGSLSTIPFELLQTEDNKFLLEEYNITYSSSLKYLFLKSTPDNNSKYLGFAPSFTQTLAMADPVRNELSKIPGAIEEVNALQELLEGLSFTENGATETNFRNISDQYGLIHLATHAIIDDANPDASRLVFSLNEDTLNDGYLHAYEIYNLKLNASLATLSACNTGFGKINQGEGVMSLSRAFAYAGVPATLVSLWPASDKSTPQLMKLFYQNLKEGQSKDEALNNARKQYLVTAKGKARHPFYWGGFVLIGDSSPIEDDRNLLVYLIPSLLIVVMILTLYRRKKNS